MAARAAEPNFARFTFEQFAAARVLVRSRWFLTRVKGKQQENALIPLGDAPNHHDAPSLDYNHRHDDKPRTYDFRADHKIAAGGEVTILYGHFTPSAFLTDYGFTQDGDHPRSVLHVDVDKKPLSLPYPTEELKKSISTYGVVVAAKTMRAGRGGASQRFLASIVEAGRRAARAKILGAWREDLAVMAHRKTLCRNQKVSTRCLLDGVIGRGFIFTQATPPCIKPRWTAPRNYLRRHLRAGRLAKNALH